MWPQSFLEWTRSRFEQSAVEFYTILLGDVFRLFYRCRRRESVQLYSDMMSVLARDDVEVHLCAHQTVTEQSQLCGQGVENRTVFVNLDIQD